MKIQFNMIARKKGIYSTKEWYYDWLEWKDEEDKYITPHFCREAVDQLTLRRINGDTCPICKKKIPDILKLAFALGIYEELSV